MFHYQVASLGNSETLQRWKKIRIHLRLFIAVPSVSPVGSNLYVPLCINENSPCCFLLLLLFHQRLSGRVSTCQINSDLWEHCFCTSGINRKANLAVSCSDSIVVKNFLFHFFEVFNAHDCRPFVDSTWNNFERKSTLFEVFHYVPWLIVDICRFVKKSV